ncbi:MFS transporter [Anaeromusa acidaminophila]|uniref:MFS transporter n=1 Tax=Anaeromusa acidaminophila TaxID=81464 RepID=UPI000379F6B3|nr:MFS transporter [Anaeromusa acidaminophila]
MNSKKSWGVHQYWGWVVLLALTHFTSDFYNNFLPPLLPFLVNTMHISLTTGGLLAMVYAITSCLLQPFFGYWVDRQGSTWPLIATIPASAFFICLSGEAPSPLFLFLLVAIAGMVSSVFHPLASALVARVTDPSHRAFSMSLFISGGNIGFAVAPALLTGYLANLGLERLWFLFFPALALAIICLVSRLHLVPLRDHQQFTFEENTTAPSWYRSKPLLLLNISMTLRCWTQVAFLTFLPLLLPLWGASAALGGTFLTVYLLGGALGSFCGGWAGDRWGHARCIQGCLLLALLSLGLFLFSNSLSWSAWVLIFLGGAGLQGSLPSSIVWAQAILPQNAAMASGMMLGLTFGLGGVGAAISGAWADLWGIPISLAISLLPVLLASILLHRIPSPKLKSN